MTRIVGYHRWLMAAVISAVLVAATVTAITHYGPGTRVLGEKIVGSGSSTPAASTNGCNGNGNCNGQTGNDNANKSFTIGGTAVGLYPGGTVQLHLAVTNTLNQDMTVNALSATLSTITKAAGAPSGTCAPTVTIGAWTGSSFTLPKNTTAMAAPGYVPVTLSHAAPDACQGATFTLTYSGTAAQK